MSGQESGERSGPDLEAEGIALEEIPDGGLVSGRFGDENVVLVRKGDAVYCIGASCTHYGGPLAEGIFDGDCVRCPLHHAHFRPETGEAVRAPAFDPLLTFATEIRDGHLFITGRVESARPRRAIAAAPSSVVVVGGGAAGFAAVEMLRREGYEGAVTLFSADKLAPYDRPNLSKDFLAGSAPEEWMPLRSDEWYEEARIDLRLGSRVAAISPSERRVTLEGGEALSYGALLLAPGATPVRLRLPGVDLPHVHVLRSMADSRAIVAGATAEAKRVVVVGASFIGLEVAAALVERGLEVHVVAPEAVPMERVLGAELGGFVRSLHEAHGVRFHLGRTVRAIDVRTATLDDDSHLDADLVVFGVGVRPELGLAESAGLSVDRGVLVDERLRTSADGIWAAGDVASWPDPWSGERIRVEHWVVAELQGQAAARDILGIGEPFTAAPFFWSQHYDVRIDYVGHARRWSAVELVGDLDRRDALVAYRDEGRVLAVATIGRERQSLAVQVAMERGDAAAVERIVRGGGD